MQRRADSPRTAFSFLDFALAEPRNGTRAGSAADINYATWVAPESMQTHLALATVATEFMSTLIARTSVVYEAVMPWRERTARAQFAANVAFLARAATWAPEVHVTMRETIFFFPFGTRAPLAARFWVIADPRLMPVTFMVALLRFMRGATAREFTPGAHAISLRAAPAPEGAELVVQTWRKVFAARYRDAVARTGAVAWPPLQLQEHVEAAKRLTRELLREVDVPIVPTESAGRLWRALVADRPWKRFKDAEDGWLRRNGMGKP